MKLTTIAALTIGTIIFLMCFTYLTGMINQINENCEKETKCYKTECSFWGCKQIKVDVDSPQCEIKKEECVR